jgi:hypothetical protein
VIANKRILLAGMALALAAPCGSAAFVQSAGGMAAASDGASNFRRDRNVSVRQRRHKGYEAPGLRVGAFMVWPKLTSTVERTDNVYATATNEKSDTVFHITPELNATSNWSRHALTAYARAAVNRFLDFETENTEDYSLGATGRLDVIRNAQINGGFDFSRLTEPRTSAGSPGGAIAPIQYKLSSGYISGSREFNRLRLSTRADTRKFNYLDGVTTGSLLFSQDDRDRRVNTLMGRADYAISPDTALFVQMSGNKRAYDLKRPEPFVNRDSEGVEALVGANFEVSALMRGELGVGYLTQNFDDPDFNDISGLGVRGQVEWFPTQLTTVTFSGSRTLEDAGIVGSAGYLSTNVGAQVDHELLRNVIVTGQLGYGDEDYRGENFNRKDKRLTGGLAATYLMNRNVGVTVGYSLFKQKSRGANGGEDFTVNKFGATLTLQY